MNDKKKIKVGTLTFHKSLNYGSFLQAYALQQKLMMMGCDTELIDFEPSGFKKMYSDLLPPVNMWNITYDYIHLRLWKCVKSRRIGFENAARKLLKLSTEKYDAFTGLKGAEEKYDAVICGSDQIWNSYANDFDLNYMLAGLKGVSKIAYAVSINKGRYEESKDEPAIRKALMDFDRLSVREQNGSKYLEKYLDNKKSSEVVLDPTLLHPSSFYDRLAGERMVNEPYIFLFSIHFKDHVRKAAEILSKKLNMPVYTLFSGRGTKNSLKAASSFHMLDSDVGPETFLNLIKYADFVAADSFHGTAFSIIYRKEFVSVYSDNKDIRIGHILSELKLDDRYVTPAQLENFDENKKVDYTAAETILAEKISASEQYIRSALEGIA